MAAGGDPSQLPKDHVQDDVSFSSVWVFFKAKRVMGLLPRALRNGQAVELPLPLNQFQIWVPADVAVNTW